MTRNATDIKKQCDDIVTKMYNERVIQKIINSGLLRRFGVCRTNTDIAECESCVMTWLLEQPDVTVSEYNKGLIIKYIGKLCVKYNQKEMHYRRRHPRVSDFIFKSAKWQDE